MLGRLTVFYITVSIKGLSVAATKDDIRRHFERLGLPNSEPAIGQLIIDPVDATKVTTVTFKQPSKKACLAAYQKLKEEPNFEVAHPQHTCQIGVSKSFFGLTTVACRGDQPSFE
jgi:hypothetical protein